MLVHSVSNNVSCRAVNPKYLKMAQEEYAMMHTVSGELMESLQFDILTRKISKQDGADTIKALYQYTKKKYHVFLDGLMQMTK
jgi:hypothetical protein